jgi:uncharacterized protein (TIGR02266 family)
LSKICPIKLQARGDADRRSTVKRKKILLVDDVDLFLELEKTFFRREVFDLLVARTGKEAYEMVVTHRPDLVFMDLCMPEMNGDEACRRVKADPELRATPVVMVTLAGRADDLARCREAGCDDILLKPINRHHFMAAARKHLQVLERTVPRIGSRLPIRYGKGTQGGQAHSVNLSRGGVFIETAEVMSPGEVLSLEISLPEGPRTVCCSGLVVWVNHPVKPAKPRLPCGIGVRFVDLDPEDLRAIEEFVKRECLSP